MNNNTIHIVHAIDTEGPLYESLDATFSRLRDTFDIFLAPSYDNLQKLRNKEINLKGKEEIVSKFLHPNLLSYNDSWDKIEAMLKKIMGKDFRLSLTDSFKGGWIYNWHCLDHVGYDTNPRRREMGYHSIHDRYIEFIDKFNSSQDAIEWHFHPMSTYKEANRCATSYLNSNHLQESLARRIIDRNFFPSVFRAGFQTERPDSNWFLEQWIPFDCSNTSIENYEELEFQNDMKNGRFNDWRGAPCDWSIYNPDLYDHRKPGNLNRWIGRFLNFNTRFANITPEEIEKAFKKAQNGEQVLMGLASHDWRDIQKEIETFLPIFSQISKRYPNVKFKYSRAKDAFNEILYNGKTEELKLEVSVYEEEGIKKLKILTKESDVFGPQPFLAIKTKSKRYIHDNLDFGLDGKSWHYVFDAESVPGDDVQKVGIAANNKYGNTFIKVLEL